MIEPSLAKSIYTKMLYVEVFASDLYPPEDISSVWVLSTGRCGTKTLDAILSASPGICSFHEPMPRLHSYHPDAIAGVETDLSSLIHDSRIDLMSFVHQMGHMYAECQHRMTFYARSIKRAFPKAKFIWLMRDMDEFVESATKWHWYDMPVGLPEYWCRTNEFILEFVKELPREDWEMLNFDAIKNHRWAEFKRIFDWLGVEDPGAHKIEAILNQPLNVGRPGKEEKTWELFDARADKLHKIPLELSGGHEMDEPDRPIEVSRKKVIEMFGPRINKSNTFMPLSQYIPMMVHTPSTYKGVQTGKWPCDAWVYQEIIYKHKPNVIIEIGNLAGGSSLMFRDLLKVHTPFPDYRVIGVDINHFQLSKDVVDAEHIFWVEGDAKLDSTVDKVKELLRPTDRVMVIDDSNHEPEHTYQVLMEYSPFVSKGQYFIVEDTTLGHIIPKSHPEYFGAHQAVERFLEGNTKFRIDAEKEKWFYTNNTDGFLERIR